MNDCQDYPHRRVARWAYMVPKLAKMRKFGKLPFVRKTRKTADKADIANKANNFSQTMGIHQDDRLLLPATPGS